MSSLTVNSVNSLYVRTSVAQQKVAADRANIIASETQLRQDQAQLEKDLTYLANLQQRTRGIQQTQNDQAQENAMSRIERIAKPAQESAQRAATFLAIASSANDPVGANIDINA